MAGILPAYSKILEAISGSPSYSFPARIHSNPSIPNTVRVLEDGRVTYLCRKCHADTGFPSSLINSLVLLFAYMFGCRAEVIIHHLDIPRERTRLPSVEVIAAKCQHVICQIGQLAKGGWDDDYSQGFCFSSGISNCTF